ncbi:hypothetical protein F2Q70_00002303 [Brassica cretica]|uniref:Uncharacterized protein n=1 Tax=Brassica cretica TaxID=69181 RepID=A0A3N6R4T9_BRACR|nr:hypothetical protein F2Q70_00002303 [Brassica cretica]KAF3565298.1 hypothetical protein DY000_02013708 [Brassica cretica]
MSEGEQKPTPVKHEPRLETRNNIPNLQSILGGGTIQTYSGKHGERESHRDTSSDESCNKMREHRWKSRQNEIIKSWSRPRAIEVRSLKTIS